MNPWMNYGTPKKDPVVEFKAGTRIRGKSLVQKYKMDGEAFDGNLNFAHLFAQIREIMVVPTEYPILILIKGT